MRGPAAAPAILLLPLLVALTACRSVPAIHYWDLRSGIAVEPPAAGRQGLAIGVKPFAVDPPYDDGRLVWRRGDSAQVGFYNYHRWAAPLGGLVALAVAERLGGTPGVATVEPARIGTRYDAVLSGRVVVIELVESAEGREARVGVELALADPAGSILWSAALERTTAAGTAGGGGDLLADGLAGLIADARPELAATLTPSAPARESPPG